GTVGGHEPHALRAERLLFPGHQARPLELLQLRGQELGALSGGVALGLGVRHLLPRRDQARVAEAHLLERAAEAADGVEELAVTLDPTERLARPRRTRAAREAPARGAVAASPAPP